MCANGQFRNYYVVQRLTCYLNVCLRQVLDIIEIHVYHCHVPDKEWSFQDGGLYIIKKVGAKILIIIVLYRLS